jgi:tuftelin-interacting protein 11
LQVSLHCDDYYFYLFAEHCVAEIHAFPTFFFCIFTEADIQRLDIKACHERDVSQRLIQEKNSFEKQLENEKAQVARLEHVLDVISQVRKQVSDKVKDPEETLDHLLGVFHELHRNYPTEYRANNLRSTALALGVNAFRAMMNPWKPLEDPSLGLRHFQRWKQLLADNKVHDNSDQIPLLAQPSPLMLRLISETWLPAMRRTVIRDWNPREPDALIQVLESWSDTCGEQAIRYVVEQYVMSRLVLAAEQWDPRSDPVPVHQWLHPWLPVVGNLSLTSVHDIVRRKLASVLTQWYPSDASALIVLMPWREAFGPKHFEQLLLQSIVPKLVMCVREMLVSFVVQGVEPLLWLFAWADVLPETISIAILEAEFFPKWQSILSQWLFSGTADYTLITQWYMAWKALFPPKLLNHDRLQLQFKQALDLMNMTLSGTMAVQPPLPSAPPPPTPTTVPAMPANGSARGEELSVARARGMLDDGSMSYRDVVAKFVSFLAC